MQSAETTSMQDITSHDLESIIGGQRLPDPVTLTKEHSAQLWPSLPKLPATGPEPIEERGMTFPGGNVLACSQRGSEAPQCSVIPASPR